MRGEPSCPRCGGRVGAPGLFADAWRCATHGPVHPVQPVVPPGADALAAVLARTRVPVWMPWPLPVGWLLTGVASAGDDAGGGRASVVVCSGPAPGGGAADLLLVAEEPGVGLGARYAGLPTGPPESAGSPESAGPEGGGTDVAGAPPPGEADTPAREGEPVERQTAPGPRRTVLAAGHPVELSAVAGAPEDRAAHHGTAGGQLLWAVGWPGDADPFQPDGLVLTDLRTAARETELIPCGTLSARLLG